MPPTDWLAVVNGAMLAVLTIKTFWGWVFGREHAEQNLAERVKRLEQDLAELDRQCTQHKVEIAVLSSKLPSRRSG